MITTATYLLVAKIDGEEYHFQYEHCYDVWTALEQFWHEDYPEALIDKGGGLFPITIMLMLDGKVIATYHFTFNCAIFHAFFDHGHTASGPYTLDQFAKDIAGEGDNENEKKLVIYRQLRRRTTGGEIETYPIVSENIDVMEQLRDKCNKYMDGGFEVIPWDSTGRDWKRLKEETFVVI